MQFFTSLWTLCLQYAGQAGLWDQAHLGLGQTALEIPIHHYDDGQKPIWGSCNTPDHRDCWSKGFNIHTDYEQKWPKGKLVEKSIYLSNSFWAGDGYNDSALLINNTYPGPAIEGDWGDTFRITVYNDLTNDNGTAIHWHGVRQWHTNYADGVAGVTQCPIPPGQSQVYEFTATQYGTSWYHSHFSLQYTDGIAGPIVIHGPASANYDVDLGPLSITDWYHQDAFSLWYIEQGGSPAPDAPSKLMNGKYGTVKCVPDQSKCVPAEASPFTQVFEKGKRYLWRIINMSAVAHYTFWIDGHNFTVISTDFVPITPFETHNITVAIGQRYDIIVEANADLTSGTDFWINMFNCDKTIDVDQPFTGIIRYDNKSTAIPSTTAPKVPTPDGCHDSPSSLFKPVVPRTVPRPTKGDVEALQFDVVHYETSPTSNIYVWDMANTTMQINWSNPSLSYAGVGSQPKPFPKLYAPIPINGTSSSWKYFVIQGNSSLAGLPTHPSETTPSVAHPIHLHGHDFVILRQQPGRLDLSTFDPSTLPTDNPARRDVAMLDKGGHLILAFQTDNPGIWLVHCHIAWHVSAGLVFQFVERESEIPGLVPKGVEQSYKDQCQKWTAFYNTSPQRQEDSGV